eukprot:superscaffoldBa00005632_g20589
MLAVFAVVLCLMSVSRSAPLDCENLLRSTDQLDLKHWEGKWVLIAGSFKDKVHEDLLKGKDSVTIDFHDSTFTQSDHHTDQCRYYSQNISVVGSGFGYKVGSFNITGTLVHTSCQDCMVFRLDYQAPVFTTTDFYLLSKRRQLEQKELEEFKSQVECLQMPAAHMMDPTKELCPEEASSIPAAPAVADSEVEFAVMDGFLKLFSWRLDGIFPWLCDIYDLHILDGAMKGKKNRERHDKECPN